MERDTNKKPLTNEPVNENIDAGNEQNGRTFKEEEQVVPGKGILHHGRPLSDMELEELRIHKQNNEFLGIPDTPELGTGSGSYGGGMLDEEDLQNKTSELGDEKREKLRNSNFGRNYQGGVQSQDHFIEEESKHEKKDKDKKK